MLWLLLAWCSHGYCDVIDCVIVIYLGSRVLSVVPRVVVDLEFLVLYVIVLSAFAKGMSQNMRAHYREGNRSQFKYMKKCSA